MNKCHFCKDLEKNCLPIKLKNEYGFICLICANAWVVDSTISLKKSLFECFRCGSVTNELHKKYGCEECHLDIEEIRTSLKNEFHKKNEYAKRKVVERRINKIIAKEWSQK